MAAANMEPQRSGYFKQAGITVAFPQERLRWYFLTEEGIPKQIRDAERTDFLAFVLPLLFEMLMSNRVTVHSKQEIMGELTDLLIYHDSWQRIDRWGLLNLLAEQKVVLPLYQTITEAYIAAEQRRETDMTDEEEHDQLI